MASTPRNNTHISNPQVDQQDLTHSDTQDPTPDSLAVIKSTLQNLIAVIEHDRYKNGVDPNTLVNTINDLCNFISDSNNKKIRMPVPMDNINNGYTAAWFNDTTTNSRSRSTSNTSYASNEPILSRNYELSNLSSNYTKRAVSVTSSSYSTKYTGFFGDEDDNDDQVYVHRGSTTGKGLHNTMKVNGAVARPTPSIEDLYTGCTDFRPSSSYTGCTDFRTIEHIGFGDQ